MKKRRLSLRILRFVDNTVDRCLMLFFLILLLIGGYGLYDSYLVYTDAMDDSILKYKPGYESDEPIEKEIIKEDMVAWLTMDNTKIDYPVMQGEENTDYLDTDPFGDYSLSGSIFLDSRNSRDFSDPYSLVYGHHMEHDMMFGALDAYLDEEFFRENHSGTLTVGKTEYALDIFAVVEADGTTKEIFAPTEIEPEVTLEYALGHYLYLDDGRIPEEGERMVALSTCKYPDTAERTIVFCSMSKKK